jgi:hypothetical protein
MTDYYPLIARAVAGLAKSTGESRRALYDRARSALLAQLRNLDPPLPDTEITRERLLLEEAIRKVEADAARQPRPEPPRPNSPAKERATPARSPEPKPAAAGFGRAATQKAEPGSATGRLSPPVTAEDSGDAKPSTASAQWVGQFRNKDRERSQNVAAEALKGFRDLVAEVRGESGASEAPGPGPASTAENRPAPVPAPGQEPVDFKVPAEPGRPRRPAPKPPRSADETESDRFEPRVEPPLPRAPRRDESQDSHPRLELPPSPQRSMHARQFSEPPPRRERGRSARALIAVLSVLIVVGIALALYWQRDRLGSAFLRSPASPQREATPSRPKISDRVGQPGSATAPGSKEAAPAAAVAQRVVLYEEDSADAQGKRYVGTVVWRTEAVSPGAGQAPELAVKGELEIPERRINMTLSLRRNADKALPASHTIEIMFNLPADFPFGGISNVPGILMKQAEQTRGSPLAGLAVKVTSGFFLIGLSAADNDMQRNLELLKERSWFDIPIVYNNGRRAILAIEKGTPGERVFKDAFTAWGE